MSTVYFRTPAGNVFQLGEDGTLIHLCSRYNNFIGLIFPVKHTIQEMKTWFGVIEIIEREEVILNV